MDRRLKGSVIWLEAAAAVLIGLLSVWTIYFSCDQAAREKATIGYVIDAGAVTYAAAVLYFIPTAALFGLAALSAFKKWRFSWALQILAITWAAVLTIGTVLGYFQ